MPRFINLVGQKFGRLTVVRRDHQPHNTRHMRWLCKCTCGKSKVIMGHSLRTGATTSCGCWRSEYQAEKAKGRGHTLPKSIPFVTKNDLGILEVLAWHPGSRPFAIAQYLDQRDKWGNAITGGICYALKKLARMGYIVRGAAPVNHSWTLTEKGELYLSQNQPLTKLK